MESKTHTVTTRDGVRVAFNHYANGGGRSAVIVCPGFFKGKDARIFRQLAGMLIETCDVLCLDFRGHGRSGGLYTFSAREGADLEAVLGWAGSRYERLALMGFSLGGAIAINTASRCPGRVRSVITVGAPAAFERIEARFWRRRAIEAAIRGLGPGSGCRPGNFLLPKERPVETIGGFERLPALFIHGTEDPIVDVRHSRELYEAAPPPKQLRLIPGGGHAEALIREQPETFRTIAQEWLASTLSTTSTTTGRER